MVINYLLCILYNIKIRDEWLLHAPKALIVIPLIIIIILLHIIFYFSFKIILLHVKFSESWPSSGAFNLYLHSTILTFNLYLLPFDFNARIKPLEWHLNLYLIYIYLHLKQFLFPSFFWIKSIKETFIYFLDDVQFY